MEISWYNYLQLVLICISICIMNSQGSSCPSSFTQHTYYYNKCYHVSSSKVKGNGYDSYCTLVGGKRASVHNKAIQDFVSNTLTTGEYFIGLNWHTSIPPKIIYTWADGNMIGEWSKLAPSSPAAKETNTFVASNGEWYFYKGVHKKYALCEITIGQITDTNISLVGGNALCGRLEVYHDGIWGTISDSHPQSDFGVFVCNQFGSDFVEFTSSCVTNNGTGMIWLESVRCPLNASTFNDCVPYVSKWGPSVTDHSSDVHVKCSVRLTGISDTTTEQQSTIKTTEYMTTGDTFTIATTEYTTTGDTSTIATTEYTTTDDTSIETTAYTTGDTTTETTEHRTTSDTTETTESPGTVEISTIYPSSAVTEFCIDMCSAVNNVTYTETITMTQYVIITETLTHSITIMEDSVTETLTHSITIMEDSVTETLTHSITTMEATITETLTHSITTMEDSVTETLIPNASTPSTIILSSNLSSNITSSQVLPSSAAIEVVKYNRKTSAMYSTATVYDMRPSSVAIGTVGVIVLCAIVSFIIGSDCYRIMRFFMTLIRYLKRLSRKKCKSFNIMRGNGPTELDVYTVYVEELTRCNSNTGLVPVDDL